MNRMFQPPSGRAPTQAAEGLPRWRWTLDEFERLIEQGFFSEQNRIELIGGELVTMSPKGNRHDLVRDELQDFFVRRLPEHLKLSSEIGWRPEGQSYYLEPDIYWFTREDRELLAFRRRTYCSWSK